MGEPRFVLAEGHFSDNRRRKRRLTACKTRRFDCCLDDGDSEQEVSEDEGAPVKKRLLEDIYRDGPSSLFVYDKTEINNLERSRYDDLVCKICKQGDAEEEMLICDGCDQGFHMYCLCPILITIPKGKWFCPICSKKDRVADFPLVQKKIIDFFRIQRPLTRRSASPKGLDEGTQVTITHELQYENRPTFWSTNRPDDHMQRKNFERNSSKFTGGQTQLLTQPYQMGSGYPSTWKKGRRRKRHSLCVYKKKRRLLPHVPSKDPARRLQQMASLATALTSTNVEFSDELTYVPGLAPESANCVALERGGMQVIGKEDKAVLDLCKLMCSRGEWPPLMVTRDPRQGFVVEADSHIKDMTLIAEYTGDIDYMQSRVHDESDSIMGLLFTDDPSKELVICPDKRGNIARFISGINNHTLEGKRKQNLRCVRFDINGQARALLVAIRDIAKGERLYYDYNAFHKEYPTQHFV